MLLILTPFYWQYLYGITHMMDVESMYDDNMMAIFSTPGDFIWEEKMEIIIFHLMACPIQPTLIM